MAINIADLPSPARRDRTAQLQGRASWAARERRTFGSIRPGVLPSSRWCDTQSKSYVIDPAFAGPGGALVRR